MARSSVFLAPLLDESSLRVFEADRRFSSALIDAATASGVRVRSERAAGVPNDDRSINRAIAVDRPSLFMMRFSFFGIASSLF
jgi:hypothetical protein